MTDKNLVIQQDDGTWMNVATFQIATNSPVYLAVQQILNKEVPMNNPNVELSQ